MSIHQWSRNQACHGHWYCRTQKPGPPNHGLLKRANSDSGYERQHGSQGVQMHSEERQCEKECEQGTVHRKGLYESPILKQTLLKVKPHVAQCQGSETDHFFAEVRERIRRRHAGTDRNGQ